MENKQNNFYANLNRLLRFFERNEAGYAFACLSDLRQLEPTNQQIADLLKDRGQELIILNLKKEHDTPFVEQIRQSLKGTNKALIVNNLSVLINTIDKDNTGVAYNYLQELNFARESLIKLNTPILFWLKEETISLLSNRAADLYRQRSINTLHFENFTDDLSLKSSLVTRYTVEFRSTEEYQALELKLKLKQQQLKDAEENKYPTSRIANDLVLSLAQTYSEMDLHTEATKLLSKYEEHIDTSKYARMEKLASILFAAKKYKKATTYYHKALELSIDNIDSQAYIHFQLADIYYETGQYEQSQLAIEKSAELYKRIDNKVNLSAAYERIGRLYQSLGDLDKALQFFELDIELTKELYQSNPKSESPKNGLAISYSRLGDIHQSLGDLDKALPFFELRSKLGEELYQANPKSENLKNGLAISYEKLGGIYQSLGDLDKALEFFELEINLFKELYQSNPKREKLKNNLAISYSKLGGIYQSLGDLDKALEFFELRNKLGEELYQSNPKSEELKKNLAISYSNLGDIHQSLGDLDKALEFFELDIELTKELYQSNPKNEELKNNLAISYSKLGGIYLSLEKEKEAQLNYKLSQNLAKDLATENKKNINNQSNYAEITAILAIFSLHENKKNAQASEDLESAIAIWQELFELTKRTYYNEKRKLAVQYKNGESDYKSTIINLTKE